MTVLENTSTVQTRTTTSSGIWRFMPVRFVAFFLVLLCVDAACQAGPALLMKQVPGLTKDVAALASAGLVVLLMIPAYRLLVRGIEKRIAQELGARGLAGGLPLGALIGFALFALVYAYLGIAVVVVLALVLLVVIEVREQRPKHIFFAVLLIAVMLVILYWNETNVLIEGARVALF